jgi:hypothetical protein
MVRYFFHFFFANVRCVAGISNESITKTVNCNIVFAIYTEMSLTFQILIPFLLFVFVHLFIKTTFYIYYFTTIIESTPLLKGPGSSIS